MERTPLIGITVDHNDEKNRFQLPYSYAAAIVAAGGAAVLLPFAPGMDAATQIAAIDGLLLTGGNDIDPSAWGEARHPSAKAADAQREAHERALLAEAEKRGVPVLAVCMGMQLMNAMRGGSLMQHLPDVNGKQEHRREDLGWDRRHGVSVTEGSLVAQIVGAGELEVNTSHHQAVARVGAGLKVTAVAPDGTIEAVEDPTKRLFVGVQWHPERMTDHPEHLALFRRLVEEAREFGMRQEKAATR
jgi:putative glutamine amidotransferase